MRNFNRHVYDRTDGMFGRMNDAVSFRIEMFDDGTPTEFKFNVAITNADEGDRFSRPEANRILDEKQERGQDEFHGVYFHSLTAVQNCLLTMAETYVDRRHRGILDEGTAAFVKRALHRANNVIEFNNVRGYSFPFDEHFDEDFVDRLIEKVEK